jgi:MerR family redox-sensitive transcriptional activator SoxR
MSDLLTIGEVSRRSGVASSGGGHRHYPRAVLRRIAFIVFAQRIGFSLDEIKAELDQLPSGRVPTGRDWSRLSRTWTSKIDERIAELERLRTGLTACIGCGCLTLGQCSLSNPADRAARLGPGPRYWIGDRPPR